MNLLIKEEKERTYKISDKVLDSARDSDKEAKIQNEFNKKVNSFMKKMKNFELALYLLLKKSSTKNCQFYLLQ